MADHVRALGVVFMVNDKPYICMFPLDRSDHLVVANGQTITLAIEGITTEPWAGVENMDGMLPLTDIIAPRPPKFDTLEEAEAWLDQYPQHV